MVFWLLALVMAAGVAAAVLAALVRPGAGAAPDPGLGVFRAQLAEIDRDLARGLIGAAEADSLRTEVKRRVLDHDRAPVVAVRPAGVALPMALVLAALAGAFGLYLSLGAPGYPDLPHRDRVARAEALKAARPSQASAEAEAEKRRPAPPAPDPAFEALMAKLRAAVAGRPGDQQGLRLLAGNERKLGNLAAAARAEAQLIAALGDKATAADHATLADMLVNAAGGIVTPEAEAAIAATLKADPGNGTARFYAGLMEAQTGRPDRAFLLWRDLMKDSPADAPWMPFLSAQMEDLAAAAGADYTPPEAPAAGDQAAMIAGMVDGLEARLMAGGGSAAEWAQLLRALGVLKETDRARAAWAAAEKALAGDAAGLAEVRAEALGAGVAE